MRVKFCPGPKRTIPGLLAGPAWIEFVNKKLLIDLIGVLLIALVIVVGYKLSPVLLPKADVTLQPDGRCDLQQQPCSATVPGGGKIVLSLAPRPIPMLRPLAVEVTTDGLAPGRVEVDFAGVDMNMGLNRPELADQGGGRYAGSATLPVCVTGAMDWQVTVLIETARERLAVPYRFAAADH